MTSATLTSQGGERGYILLDDCQPCNGRKGGRGSNEQPVQQQHTRADDPKSLEHQSFQQEIKQKRTVDLIHINEDADLRIQLAAVDHSKRFDNTVRGKYSIWRREYQNSGHDTILKHMKDQVILAKVYSSIADSRKMRRLRDELNKLVKESNHAIGEGTSDAELTQSAFQKAARLGHALSSAKAKLHDCETVARKLKAMVQVTEEHVMALKKKNIFLQQFASWTIPKSLDCLSLQLTNDYDLHKQFSRTLADKNKVENPSLYHYAIFSDNVLSTSVVVSSTISNAREPHKHVFHIITDRENSAAMKMWFIGHTFPSTVHVESIDAFKWLNSSYCPILRQIESENMKEFYFKAHSPPTLKGSEEHLKFRNPKYLSMLNHIRFYIPELFPKLDKMLFLDDDVVVQKDLTPLWSIDMKGMVNGAVETCKNDFHRFQDYLNFSNPKISESIDPQGCGWAFGMNIFDLKQWKKKNLTGVYHYWQDLNKDRQLWELGTLPAGLLTFYNLTYVLDPSWHLLKLGYDPSLSISQIEEAAVIHFNGNNKPWLDLAIVKFKKYWSKYVNFEDPYLRNCHVYE